MTVCITGDVHHMSLDTRDQAFLEKSEVEAAIDYAKIARDYDVPVTLFITGKAVKEEPDRVRRLAEMDNVEIGGHNYWAFTTPIHKGWRAVEKGTYGRIGSWNGPASFQRWEIQKTINALESVGARVHSWRDHAYRHDQHTLSLIADCGLSHFSDRVIPSGNIDFSGPIIDVPINAPPDHEHVYHSFRTPEFVEQASFSGPFGSDSFPVEDWCDWVLETIDTNRDTVTTVLAHPSCMTLADELDTFTRLIKRISSLDTVQMCDIDSESN